jgi:ABC-type multidrug transport system fused ATPase/permease subunit
LEKNLRRDIKVTGIAPWLTSEMTEANKELGDTTTRPPWDKRASSWRSFFLYIGEDIFEGFEYIWLAFRGIKLGTSIGDLQLLRDTGSEVYHMAWELSHTAQESTSNWKNLVYFYKCLETKPEMEIPWSPEPYVHRSGGMKIEARSIRYKYDIKNEAEVLTGASFKINPGEMVAVVGYSLQLDFDH